MTEDANIHLLILSGMSGAGKSVAIHALEDYGYYCVDNLPPSLLTALIEGKSFKLPASTLKHSPKQFVAVAIDCRSSSELAQLPHQALSLQAMGVEIQWLFLDADNTVLFQRFAETRRRHPLSNTVIENNNLDDDAHLILAHAINDERELLQSIKSLSVVVDTSYLKPAQLAKRLKTLAFDQQNLDSGAAPLLVVLESFAYKRGVPMNADFVFDMRALPNPFWDPKLRDLTGKDEAVAQFLSSDADVQNMIATLEEFFVQWLPKFAQDQRSYVSIAVGCTGGQHRSVFVVESLAQKLIANLALPLRHYKFIKQHREQGQ